ncbi:MAG: DUF3618 domain-containing protein [Thermomicrobiales bacterium]
MDQTTSPEEIRDDIQQRRHQMTNDVNELEERAKSLTDWRQQVQDRPLVAAGVALTAGLAIGLMTGGSSDSTRRGSSYGYYQAHDGRQHNGQSFSGEATQAGKHQAATKVDEIRGALMGLAATKAQEFLREAVPGYQQEEEQVRQEAGSSRHSGDSTENQPSHDVHSS